MVFFTCFLSEAAIGSGANFVRFTLASEALLRVDDYEIEGVRREVEMGNIM